VAGKGTVLFDLNSADAISQTMHRCLSDDKPKEALRCLGKGYLQRFSWEKTAAETIDVYRKVLNLSILILFKQIWAYNLCENMYG
jgi:glycosyltransferase involved in cell wall biosynthesis